MLDDSSYHLGVILSMLCIILLKRLFILMINAIRGRFCRNDSRK